MQIPPFPDFRDIELSHQKQAVDIINSYPLEASEYTFTNLFSFKRTYKFQLSILDEALIILKNHNPVSLFCPVGKVKNNLTLETLLAWLKDRTEEGYIERVPESFINEHVSHDKSFVVDETRDHFDYVYATEDLSDLKGRKFHDKRNKVNKFRSMYNYEYLPLTPDLIDECLDFQEDWCEVKECEKYYGLENEREAILQMLLNIETLGIRGGAIRINNRIEALTLGEKMVRDTFVIHVEKANTDIPGLYQVINQEFLMHEAQDCRYVNREQDLGIQGLRRSKMSYNPLRLIKKFIIRKKYD